MRHLPKYEYKGLTIVLSNPSRFDKYELLTGHAGHFFEDECLQSYCNRHQCDIRTSDTIGDGLIENTTGILLLGERAFKEWTINGMYERYNLNEQRGCKLETLSIFNSIKSLCSFSPQDCVDFQDYETRGASPNKLALESKLKFNTPDTKDSNEKHKGNTARSNFRFFLKQDTKKLIALMTGKYILPPDTEYELYPQADKIVKLLSETKGQTLYLDIETDINFNMLCFGFGFNIHRVYSVPCLDNHYNFSYSNLGSILQSLAIAMQHNEVICHNTLFDLFVLAWKYRIGVGPNIYDTMHAHKRSWPEVEKSLGHAMSHLCYEPFHKDEGVFSMSNRDQMMQLLEYNAKDIRGMILIREALDSHANKTIGLVESIEQANRSIRPDLINMLQGIKINTSRRQSFVEENDLIMNQYLRIIKILAGREILPTSNKSCVEYFHDYLGYPVLARSEKTGNPSLAADVMLKLKQKSVDKPELYDNPIIDFCLAYRSLSTQTGWLKFNTFPSENRCSTQWGMVETFRKSSGIIFKRGPKWGQNLQNPTSKACEIFEAD